MILNSHVKKHLIKNALVIVIAGIFWPAISQALSQIKVEQTNDFLLILSMFLMVISFANFAFTYEKSKLKTKSGSFLSYTSTFIFILLTALLLESLVLAVKIVYPSFYIMIFGFAILLYIGIVLYDFWDLFRAEI
ncbi:hypothetical protein HZC21_04535 [Candidatus Peregrinibacteria bacterium]|nr:hypothetical protein [Candidatus Peregrinibacteria bacterium]